MSVVAIQTAINTIFAAAWGQTTKIYGDNQKIAPNETEFVRISYRPALRRQAGIGGNRTTRQEGVIVVGIFVNNAKVQGTARINELTQLVINALQYQFAASADDDPDKWLIRLRAGDPRDIGQAVDSAYYQMNVNFAFYSDTIE